ncbi:MAG: ABC transporter ATP-binding protein [Candidatus Eisenbacteria bacterium]|nr:ABC transporter ATP-binding protein [Candidatus Eisenbacteria bacterium]
MSTNANEPGPGQSSVADRPGRPAGDRSSFAAASGPDAAAVRIEEMSKVYRANWSLRSSVGLDRLSLEVRRGEVFGYLGPNGAGKTTTLKILTGLLKPSGGRAWLMGVPIHRVESRRSLGFLPEQPYFFDHLTGVEYLEFAARLSGLSAHEATRAARHWFGRVGLGDRLRLGLRKYSKGMLQRLGLAAALVHAPRLVILDEPMSGLDPFGRRDVRDLILEQRERGVTVLFSSHILPDVEMLCDRVAIVLKGRLERVAGVGDLMDDGRHPVEVRVEGAPVLELPAAWAGRVSRVERPGESVFTVGDGALLQAVIAHLVQSRAAIRAVTPLRASLEELFMAAAEGSALRAGDGRRSA